MEWNEKLQIIIDYVENHLQRRQEPIDPHIPQEWATRYKDTGFLERLPKRRHLFPAACNQKCSKGYDFTLKGECLQRCRNNAFEAMKGGRLWRYGIRGGGAIGAARAAGTAIFIKGTPSAAWIRSRS